jgi:hypothetical protein
MSRYSVEAKDPEKFTVMVGWDNSPFAIYFRSFVNF